MKFLAIVNLIIITVAAKNTAKLQFSDIKLTSGPTQCNSTECLLVVNRSSRESLSTTEFQKCLKSVWGDCRCEATVHLTGELNEFTPFGDDFIVKLTDILINWGSFNENNHVSGTSKLRTVRESKGVCEFYGRNLKLPAKPEAPVSRCHQDYFLASLMENRVEGEIDLVNFVNAIHAFKDDGLQIFSVPVVAVDSIPDVSIDDLLDMDFHPETDSDDLLAMDFHPETDSDDLLDTDSDHGFCDTKIEKIEFSNVTWRARFEGFIDPKICSIDVCSAIISAAATTGDGSPAIVSAGITFAAAVICSNHYLI